MYFGGQMTRVKFQTRLWESFLEERLKPLLIHFTDTATWIDKIEPTIEEVVRKKLYPEKEYPYLYLKDYVVFRRSNEIYNR